MRFVRRRTQNINVKSGEITYPVKNLRFTQSCLEALNNVEGIGKTPRLLSGSGGLFHTSTPALKLGDFNFPGATEFQGLNNEPGHCRGSLCIFAPDRREIGCEF